MGFESAIALTGLTAVLVPLLVQVRSRRAGRTVPFPDVHLIRRTEREALRKRVVAGAPLLLVRAAVVVCASIALSAPYVGDLPPNAIPLREGRVGVLLDRSTSWPDAESFESGRAVARDVLESLRDAAFVVLIPYDDVPGAMVDGADAVGVVDTLERGGGEADVAAALEAGFDALRCEAADARDEAATRDAYTLIAITSSRGSTGEALPAVPEGVRVLFLPRRDGRERERCRIASVSLDGAELRVAVETHGQPLRGSLHVRLDDGARPVARHEFAVSRKAPRALASIPAPRLWHGTTLLSLELVTESGRAIPRHFIAVDGGGPLRVGVPTGGEGRRRDCVLGRAAMALSAASAGASRGPRFEAFPCGGADVDRDALDGLSALLLTGNDASGAADWRLMGDYVRDGGVLIAALPDRWTDGATRVLGVAGAGGPVVGRTRLVTARGGRHDVGGISFDAREDVTATSARPWLIFEDGSVAVFENRLGRGRVLALCVDPDELAVDPSAAVSFASTVIDRALEPGAVAAVVDVGEAPLMIRSPSDPGAQSLLAISPGGRRIALRPLRAAPDGTPHLSVPCDVPGLWRVVSSVRGGDEHCRALIGVNASDPGRPAAKGSAGSAGRVEEMTSGAAILQRIAGRGATRLGPLFAVFAILACVAEPVIRRRMKAGGAA